MHNNKPNYTQEDTELLADWFKWSNQANTTANISKEVKQCFDNTNAIRIKLHQDIIKNSNWKFYFTKKTRKLRVKYDNNR